ncbi:MAG: hypothetical protein ABL927_07785 [Bdellovibrionales bacterium]
MGFLFTKQIKQFLVAITLTLVVAAGIIPLAEKRLFPMKLKLGIDNAMSIVNKSSEKANNLTNIKRENIFAAEYIYVNQKVWSCLEYEHLEYEPTRIEILEQQCEKDGNCRIMKGVKCSENGVLMACQRATHNFSPQSEFRRVYYQRLTDDNWWPVSPNFNKSECILKLPEANSSPPASTLVLIKKSDLKGQTVPILMQGGRIEPIFSSNNSIDGLLLRQINSGSILEKMKLLAGDKLLAFDGAPIKSPQDAFLFFNMLINFAKFELTIQRDGKVLTIAYDYN